MLTFVDISSHHKAELEMHETEHRLRLAQLGELAAQLADTQELERKRIAEGLHNSVCQQLATAQIKLNLASSTKDPAQRTAGLEQTNTILDQALDEIRSLTFQLSSTLMLGAGLIPAIRELCHSITAQTGLKFRIYCPDKSLDCKETLRTTLYHCLQELLYNAAKHSGAKLATIKIEPSGRGGVRVHVVDKGSGFDTTTLEHQPSRKHGLGLCLLHERMNTIGGSLQIDSTPGKGTRVTLDLPGI